MPMRTIDPTGAGDAFTAGFLAKWVKSHQLVASGRSGVAVAARAAIGGRPPV